MDETLGLELIVDQAPIPKHAFSDGSKLYDFLAEWLYVNSNDDWKSPIDDFLESFHKISNKYGFATVSAGPEREIEASHRVVIDSDNNIVYVDKNHIHECYKSLMPTYVEADNYSLRETGNLKINKYKIEFVEMPDGLPKPYRHFAPTILQH